MRPSTHVGNEGVFAVFGWGLRRRSGGVRCAVWVGFAAPFGWGSLRRLGGVHCAVWVGFAALTATLRAHLTRYDTHTSFRSNRTPQASSHRAGYRFDGGGLHPPYGLSKGAARTALGSAPNISVYTVLNSRVSRKTLKIGQSK